MQLILHDDLLLIPVTIAYQGCQCQIPNVVVDTGSATTMISTDTAAQFGITPDPQDILYVVHGIGRHVDYLQIGARAVEKI